MTAITSHSQIVPQPATSTPALRAADQGVADALEWVLSDNTQRVYGTQWRLFTGWCDEVGLRSLPAELLTVARYLAARANSGALTVDVLAVIRLTAVQPRLRGRGFETAEQAEERGRYDVALVAVLSDAGLRRSEALSLTWGDVQRWDDGSGRVTVVRSKTDVEAQGAVVAITPAAMRALDAIRPAGVAGDGKVFGLSESQIARRVKAIAKLQAWLTGSPSAGTAVGWAWPGAWPRTACPPTRSNARAAGSRAAVCWAVTPAANPPVRRCGICDNVGSSAQI